MARIDLNSRLVGSGSTDTLTCYGLEVYQGGVRSVGALPREYRTVTNITTAGATTYTAAQLATGIITRDPNGAGRTDLFDTAANIITGLGLANDGDCAVVYLINTADAAEAITLDVNTGLTIANAGQTVAQNESAVLVLRRATPTTVVVYVLGA